MKNLITLWMEKSGNQSVLEIQDRGRVEVDIDSDSKAQTITWLLTGPLAKGAFVSMTDAEPGFEWVQPAPSSDIFGKPKIHEKNKHQLSITDDHTNHTSDGEWKYILRVEYDNTIYEIKSAIDPAKTPTNPIIINR